MSKNFEPTESLTFAIELAVGQGVNLLDRSIEIFEDITDSTLKKVNLGVSLLEQFGEDPITVRLATTGGEVYAGFGIAGRLQSSKCTIITEAIGKCMSSGALVFAAGDERIAREPVLFMMHQLSAELPEEKLLGLKAAVIQLKRDQDVYIRYIANRTGTDAKTWKSFINKAEDTYLTALEAKQLNLVTEIL
jgi:ATP-dependent protease ClpP protease subunit